MDFQNDLNNILKDALRSSGAKVVEKDLKDTLVDYLTLNRKFVHPLKRTVRLSPDLSARLNDDPHRDVILKIKSLLEEGKDINYFQSKRLLQTRMHDHLQYEWNIYHFHLSEEMDKKAREFIKQGNRLLFAYITDQEAIFLGTSKHKSGVFDSTPWVKVLHDHFPEKIEEYRDKEIGRVNPDLSSEDREELWKKGLTTVFTNIDDASYISPGIGRSTSGHSMMVMLEANQVMRWIWYCEKHFEEKSRFLRLSLGTKRFSPRLRINGGVLELYDEYSGSSYLAFPNTFE